jgi:hypothetical protein
MKNELIKKVRKIIRHNLIGCDDVLGCKNTRPETRLLYAIDFLEDSINALKDSLKELEKELKSMKEEGEI